METLLLNYRATYQIKMFDGREYLVAPAVMLTAGVHAGSKGALFYPESELQASVANWDQKPVTIRHPEAGKATDSDKVGHIANTRYANGKLVADLWLDRQRLGIVDHRVLAAVQSNRVIEVSTGLFTTNENRSGMHNGKPFVAIARNYQPDHLAILPDQQGACSRNDGCGLLQNSKGQTMSNETQKHLVLPVWNCACQDKPEEKTENQTTTNNAEGQAKQKHLVLPKMF